MNKKRHCSTCRVISYGICIFVVVLALSSCEFKSTSKEISIVYPFNKSVFPPEFPAPILRWKDKNPAISSWDIIIYNESKKYTIHGLSHETTWKPQKQQWDSLKLLSGREKIYIEISRVINHHKKTASTSFSISDDSVGAPILYREIPLPFVFAEKRPELMSFRLVNPGSDIPPAYAMRKFLVCGNCHSISGDGKYMGLDFDALIRDKGGYFLSAVTDTIVYDTSNYFSWRKLQPFNTFGLFSKISPNGRYVATTIKDCVVHYNFEDEPQNYAFSQLFFPINGILAIYDRETRKLTELPGANSPEYVQSNAFWTPDGKNIIFVRSKSYEHHKDSNQISFNDPEVIKEFVNRDREFKYDLYTIPFNEGKGGEAKPIKGASNNGMSNYFPAVSPDGKWLVFCKAENFMMLQPDSKLYIVPTEGGKARKLNCNLPLLNSWHAWSPNSKWIVFSSKGLSKFTDLFLTHIDKNGDASVPVLIENTHGPGNACNYPEFMNVPEDYKFTMIYNYVNIDHIMWAIEKNDTLAAEFLYKQYVAQDQYSLPDELYFLGKFNYDRNRFIEAEKFFQMTIEKDPNHKKAQSYLNIIHNNKLIK
jgi:hypothetical protein